MYLNLRIRISRILGILILLFFPSGLYAQILAYNPSPTEVSQQRPAAKLRDLLLEMQTKYKVSIVFDDKLLQDVVVDTRPMKSSSSVSEMLQSLLKGTGLQATQMRKDTYLIIRPRVGEQAAPVHDLVVPAQIPAPKQEESVVPVKEKGLEQVVQVQVSGQVTDEKGEALPGVNVVLKGSQLGTVSDVQGRYEIAVPDADARLIYSFVGYLSQEIHIGSRTVIDVTLLADLKALEEVVVVGYGTQKKTNLTGSVEVINGERLQNRPVANASQAMQGTVSGMNFSYGNNGAEPGAALGLQIRGQGAPYVLIDGTVGDINMINPNDIASISVLKDAAASAIYGARAPYGVILITTKAGKRDEKMQVEFSSNMSFTDPIRKPHWVDSYTFARAMNEMHDNQGESRLFAEATMDRIMAYISNPTLPETVPDPVNPKGWATYLVSNGNNNWYDIHFGSGMRHQENLSIKGGGKDMSFFISAGNSYEKGILKFGPDNYKRTNLNLKLDINLTKWWKVNLNTRLAQSSRVQPNYDSEGDYGQMIRQIYRTQPQQYLKSPNGVYSQLSRIPMVQSGSDKTIGREMMQRVATEITPLKNWTINADYSLNIPYTSFVSEDFTAYQDYVDGSLFPIATTVPSSIRKYKSHTIYNATNLYTSYRLDLRNRHHFMFMAGYQQESSSYDYLTGQKTEMITPNVPSLTTSTGVMQTGDELSHWATQGYFGRMTYDYLGKYLLEFNTRYDGTSRFADGKRWGLFPSLSLGWNVSQEEFWKPVASYVDGFKLRASWGSLGNQDVSAYQDLQLLGVNRNLAWILNGNRPAFTTAPNLINPNLTWESSKTTNVGVDLGFLKNRLQLTFDYYQRMTFNRLGPARALPAVIGAAIPNENNSELRTRGWDMLLTWKDKINKDFSYSVTAMMFDYKSVVTKYNNPTGILTTDYTGRESGEIWGYETVGLIQTKEQADQINTSKSQNFINSQVWRTGDVMYRDLNGDGVINNGKNTVADHGDIKIIGNSTPRYQFGLTLTANYKGFDFSGFLNGTAKRDLWITGNMFWGFQNWNFSILYPHHTDYYRDTEGSTYSGLGVNKDAYYPRPYSQASQYSKNQQVQTRYLQSGAYIRLKNLQLGYTVPKTLIDHIGLSRARVYFSAENLFTSTKLPIGLDPETANLGEFGNGNTMFSLAVYSFGLNVSF
jgi:TonB-linked SusC/RagA family outer membrane protein